MTAWIFAGLAAGAVLWWLLRGHVQGLRQLRGMLRQLAAGEHGRLPLLPGLPPGLQGLARDVQKISEHLQALHREADADRFGLNAILGSLSEGVLVVDRSLHIRLANPGVETLLGLTSSPVNRTMMEAFRNPALQQVIEESLAVGRPQTREIHYDTGNTQRIFELSVSPLPLGLDRSPSAAVVVFHNITRIKGLERVRREFVANVSHELRTPLTIISGYLETLLEGGLEDRALLENSLRVMFRHAARLNRLVDDLLTISRLESRSTPLELETFDVREALLHVIDQLQSTIMERGAKVHLTIASQPPPVTADPLRFEQVFFNLLDNALKYGQREDLQIRFYVEDDGQNIHIQVSDNGPGVPYEDQEHIFERFYRVHKDRSRDSGGTGLGLSIVKNVLHAHGGKVTVQSTPGLGSTFHIILPLRPPAIDHEDEA